MLVAKHAAVVDQLSGGRLTLGIAQGGRQDDFELFGVSFVGRSALRAAGDPHTGDLARGTRIRPGLRSGGPGSRPGSRAADLGGRAAAKGHRAGRPRGGWLHLRHCGPAGGGPVRPGIREAFAAQGKPDAVVAGLAYVAVGEEPQQALDEAAHHVIRYYGELWTEPDNLIHHGPATKIAEEVAAYADAIDVLILFPQIPHLDQVEQLAKHVLPAYR